MVTSYSSTRVIDTISATYNLELDPFNDTITYNFEKTGYMNWIKVSYKSVVNILSEDCGPEIVYYQLELLETSYDSVEVVDHTFPLGTKVNIKVFYE